MKKIYLFSVSIMLTLGAIAQTNLGFETWAPGANGLTSDPHPDGWYSFFIGAPNIDNDIPIVFTAHGSPGGIIKIGGVAGLATSQSSIDSFEGTSNLSLQTFTISDVTGPYASVNGIRGSSVIQEVPFTTKTLGVSFEYKTSLVGSENALVFINVFGAGIADSIIGQSIKYISTNQATWKLDTAKINYFSTSTIVDSVEIIFSSSQSLLLGTPPSLDGSVFQIDDVKLLATPVFANIVSENVDSDGSNEINVYPNPARNEVNFVFENDKKATEVRIFNTTGQLIKSVPVSVITIVGLNNADSGMYIYQIVGDNNEIIKTDKFQVVK